MSTLWELIADSDSIIHTGASYLHQFANPSWIVPQFQDPNCVVTDMDAGGYNIVHETNPNLLVRNRAISASTLLSNPTDPGNIAHRAPTWLDGLLPSSKNSPIPAAPRTRKGPAAPSRKYILLVPIGTNDSAGGPDTYDAWLTAYRDFWLARRAAGFDKLIAATICARGDVAAANAAWRAYINPRIRGESGNWRTDSGVDAVLDLEGIPQMNDYTNPALFPGDQVHPGPDAHAFAVPALSTLVTELTGLTF